MPHRIVDVHDYSLDLEQEVQRAASALRDGQLVVLPTETVYGIAGKPNVKAGLGRLRELRGQAEGAMTPHLPDAASARAYLDQPSKLGQRLMDKLWPGPVALMFQASPDWRKEAAAELGTEETLLFNPHGQVVLRCPDDLLTQSILRGAGQPVVLTRAGLPRGDDACRAPEAAGVPEQVSIILDGGRTRFSRPSTVVRVDEEGWEIVREGIYDRRMIERMLRTTVLFVCSGNTCRSPMAMALARKLVAEQVGVTQVELGEKGFDIVSAGTFAMPGMRATPQAAEAVAGMGADLASHRSQPLTVELVHRADLIVTMSHAHAEAVTGLVPSSAARTVALDPEGDIEDPIGSDAAHYRKLAEEIHTLLRQRLGETVLKQESHGSGRPD